MVSGKPKSADPQPSNTNSNNSERQSHRATPPTDEINSSDFQDLLALFSKFSQTNRIVPPLPTTSAFTPLVPPPSGHTSSPPIPSSQRHSPANPDQGRRNLTRFQFPYKYQRINISVSSIRPQRAGDSVHDGNQRDSTY
ncbi:hypothetical protein TNCV_1193431 [Trichonephila clavipes]|nr:hypothetical protein TNCV_1193431 [Trichonephila clavipes]